MALLKEKYRPAAGFEAWMREKLHTERCWLILDALALVDENERRHLTDRLKALETQGWQCRVVIVCHKLDYDRAQVPWGTLEEYELAPFRPEEMSQFMERVIGKTRRSNLYADVLRDLVPGENLPQNFPSPEDIFIGRVEELVKISNWIEEHHFRVIALTGIGGIGKSSLALAAALWNRRRFNGVIYCTAKDTTNRPRALTIDNVCGKVG